MQDVLFYDPHRDESLTTPELCRTVRQPLVEFHPFTQPVTPRQAVETLLVALLLDQELALIDSDLSPGEIKAMGIGDEQLHSVRPVEGIPALQPEKLAQHARTANNFRLTLHTSGSTGLPKQVRHNLDSLCRTLKVSERHRKNVWAMAYNPTHIAGIQVILQAFFNNNPLILLHGASPALATGQIERWNVSHLAGTPSFFRMLLPLENPVKNVRAVAIGGEPASDTLIHLLQQSFPNARIRNLYGSTEAGTLLVAEGDRFRIPPELQHLVRIQDGELQIHRSALAHLIAAPQSDDEWYHTGDMVETHPDGSFQFASRRSEWINVGGHKVDPAEVESALLEHPAVRQALVYPLKNSVLGQIPAAKVVLCPNTPADEPSLRAFLAKSLQQAKIPRKIEFVDSLPNTSSGKLSRKTQQ